MPRWRGSRAAGIGLGVALAMLAAIAARAVAGKDARTAHLTLYHDAAHPSALELPLAR